MKIVDKTNGKIYFRELSMGDVFVDDGGKVFIKVDFTGSETAVNLNSGCKVYVDNLTKVQKVNATLVIGGEEE